MSESPDLDGALSSTAGSVVVTRWNGPRSSEAEARAGSGRGDLPRLWLVDPGVSPPVPVDCLEDWVRLPTSDGDIEARLAGLAARAKVHRGDDPAPELALDSVGTLRFGNRSVELPPIEMRLVRLLMERPGRVASRAALLRAAWPKGDGSDASLRVHLVRLRRRISPLGLIVRTMRGRGYVLETESTRRVSEMAEEQ